MFSFRTNSVCLQAPSSYSSLLLDFCCTQFYFLIVPSIKRHTHMDDPQSLLATRLQTDCLLNVFLFQLSTEHGPRQKLWDKLSPRTGMNESVTFRLVFLLLSQYETHTLLFFCMKWHIYIHGNHSMMSFGDTYLLLSVFSRTKSRTFQAYIRTKPVLKMKRKKM